MRVRLGHRNRLASNSLSNCSYHSSSIATCRQSLQAGGHCQPLIAAVTFCVTTYLETVPKPGEIWELVKDRRSVRRVKENVHKQFVFGKKIVIFSYGTENIAVKQIVVNICLCMYKIPLQTINKNSVLLQKNGNVITAVWPTCASV